MHYKIPVDADLLKDVNVAVTHPSVIGYAFTEKPPKSPPLPPPPLPEKDQCKDKAYKMYLRSGASAPFSTFLFLAYLSM